MTFQEPLQHFISFWIAHKQNHPVLTSLPTHKTEGKDCEH